MDKPEVGALDEFKSQTEEFDTPAPGADSPDKKEDDSEGEEDLGKGKKGEEGEGDDEEKPKNRVERRLRAKLQAEREAGIAMAERIKVLSEQDKFKADTGSDVDTDIARIYGTETPEAVAATRILSSAFKRYAEQAEQKALEKFEAKQAEIVEANRKAESFIYNELESVEDEFEVDLTSDSPAAKKRRNGLIELVQKLSPKDSNGNITDYADFTAAYEMYQSRQEKVDGTRKKDLGSRTMTKSGTSSSSVKMADEQAEKFLKDNGII